MKRSESEGTLSVIMWLGYSMTAGARLGSMRFLPTLQVDAWKGI